MSSDQLINALNDLANRLSSAEAGLNYLRNQITSSLIVINSLSELIIEKGLFTEEELIEYIRKSNEIVTNNTKERLEAEQEIKLDILLDSDNHGNA
jgi:hypothetical protein